VTHSTREVKHPLVAVAIAGLSSVAPPILSPPLAKPCSYLVAGTSSSPNIPSRTELTASWGTLAPPP
jgi:hypothetical protein